VLKTTIPYSKTAELSSSQAATLRSARSQRSKAAVNSAEPIDCRSPIDPQSTASWVRPCAIRTYALARFASVRATRSCAPYITWC